MSALSPRRVLIVHPYGIGDLLFATPVFRALRLQPRVETVDLLLGSRTEAVVRNNPHIDKIFNIDKDLVHKQNLIKNWKDLSGLAAELTARKYDLLLDFSMRGEYAFCSKFFLGIRKRAGFAYKNRAFFHNIRVDLRNAFHEKHVVDYYCELAEKAGIPVEDRFLEFFLQPCDLEAADIVLKERFGRVPESFIAVSPGGGESWGKDARLKRWPARYFKEFIQKLRAVKPFEGIVVLGSAKEKEIGEEIIQGLPFPALNLAGDLSFTTSAAVLSRASRFVGNDGGLLHLAVALRVPVIGIYGPVAPEVYGPYHLKGAVAVYKKDLACRPCYQKFRYNAACEKNECVQELTADEAMSFVQAPAFAKL